MTIMHGHDIEAAKTDASFKVAPKILCSIAVTQPGEPAGERGSVKVTGTNPPDIVAGANR
jgi:hypothetical protein